MSETVPGSLLVTTDDGSSRAVHVDPGTEKLAAARLRADPHVLAVEPDQYRHTLATPNDPSYNQQWSHLVANAPAAWDLTTGDPTVKVAIIDTGVDATHPDLTANVVDQFDVSSGSVVHKTAPVNNDACGIGHGTFVAGVIGAVGNNNKGVAGVAWHVGIVDIAAGDPVRCGLFADSGVLTGIELAIDQGVDVINMSLGGLGDTCPTAFQRAIDEAIAAGITVVAAAGHEEAQFPGATAIPGSCNGVISVAAVGDTGAVAPYSDENDWVDIAAPGGDTSNGGDPIVSTFPGDAYARAEGTSFSSPYASGVVALMKSVNAALTPSEVERILEGTTKGTPTTRTAALGWGLVDAGAAVTAAKAAKTDKNAIPAARPSPPAFPVGLVVRISAQSGTTDPVQQAIAMSRWVFFEGSALHAIVARKDDFADALTGSTLAFGSGPMLFTSPTGHLDPDTSAELARVLPPGSRVYILGGTQAVPPEVDDDIRAIGLQPRRLAGATREGTAAQVAAEVILRVRELGFDTPKRMILATAHQWPDAVTSGSLGAWFGYPILLTDPNTLSRDAHDVLAFFKPEVVYIIGGTAVISDLVAAAAKTTAHAADAPRLAGVDRDETAVAVARRFIDDLKKATGIAPLLSVGVNLRRADGFTHILSASTAIGAFTGVFIPVEGDAGDILPPASVTLACSLDPLRGIVAGEADIVSDAVKDRLNSLLEHTAC
jgi:subtilisin family serine protease